MKIHDIISEDATAGGTGSALMSSVVMPMTPGTKSGDARRAVDPHGYGPNSKFAKKFDRKKQGVVGYPIMIKRIY